ncbi:hypothetical protein L1049_000186 [Liquidambar formosana]|uniref:F-box domain-containing protein n=1 Tax=Liquidambar formosana TaxID=63359 RepID=A0AAP0NA01_LIQFO
MRRNPLRIKPLDDRLKKAHSSKPAKPINQDKEKHEQHTHSTPNRSIPTRETEYPTIVEDRQMVLVSISRLPSDILLDILTRLSIKTLSICRYVCQILALYHSIPSLYQNAPQQGTPTWHPHHKSHPSPR